jgi:hypothetical protein
MIQNGIPRFFSSENSSEQNSKVFLIQNWFGTEFRGFFSTEKWFGTKLRGFSLPRNGLERHSEGFSLPRNGLELNSEVFLFRETGRIQTELPSVRSFLHSTE